MTITECYTTFDQSVYYPGQTITGQVVVALDRPKEVRGVELKVKGRTKFKWQQSESYRVTDAQGKMVTKTRYVTRVGKESYLKIRLILTGKGELTIGRHSYPFQVILPPGAPSTFTGKYGGIAYYGKVKVVIPFGFNKTARNYFRVENLFDLNPYTHLKNPAKGENSKTFCCFCCASGPLTLVAYVPKTGFCKTERIPITVEIDNASNVKVDSVKVALYQKIHWQAQGDRKNEAHKIIGICFGDVPENSSRTWSENMALDCELPRSIKNCNIITVNYELKVEADPNGAHTDLELSIPLTIGDIPFHDGETSAATGPTGYPNTVGTPNPNIAFNPVAPTPYPASGDNPPPYPGNLNPPPYPSGPSANPQGPYLPAPGVNPQGPYPPTASEKGQGPYPPAQAPYSLPSAQNLAFNQNVPAGYNAPAGGNSGMYPPAGSSQGFYDPNASAAPYSGLFDGSSIAMPVSPFFADEKGNTNDRTQLLPSAPPASFN